MGVLVANRARAILDQIDDLKRDVADATGHADGTVAIGLPVSISTYLTVGLVQSIANMMRTLIVDALAPARAEVA